MDNILLEVGGSELYLDIDRLSEIVRIEKENVPSLVDGEENGMEMENIPMDNGNIHIDVTKYEMYREMIISIMSYNEEVDNKMGSNILNNTPIPFKIALILY